MEKEKKIVSPIAVAVITGNPLMLKTILTSKTILSNRPVDLTQVDIEFGMRRSVNTQTVLKKN